MEPDLNTNPGCLGFLAPLLARFSQEPAEEFHYAAREQLLTPAEARFYHVLVQAAGNHAVVMMKVRLADVFKVSMSGKGYYRQFNRIAMKHVDFLLCDRETLRPLMGVELDDSSHQRADRVKRDADVDRIFRTARLPLVHIPAARAYNVAEIAALIAPQKQGKTPPEDTGAACR